MLKIYLINKVPLVIPICVVIVAMYFVLGPLIQDPRLEYVISGSILLFGIVIYFIFVHYKFKIFFLSKQRFRSLDE